MTTHRYPEPNENTKKRYFSHFYCFLYTLSCSWKVLILCENSAKLLNKLLTWALYTIFFPLLSKMGSLL